MVYVLLLYLIKKPVIPPTPMLLYLGKQMEYKEKRKSLFYLYLDSELWGTDRSQSRECMKLALTAELLGAWMKSVRIASTWKVTDVHKSINQEQGF